MQIVLDLDERFFQIGVCTVVEGELLPYKNICSKNDAKKHLPEKCRKGLFLTSEYPDYILSIDSKSFLRG